MNIDNPTGSTRPRILVVDDDPVNLAALGRLLHAHYEVLLAPSGERALQIAAGAPQPDLILLDVLMPEMNGYDVLARLRENPATRDIPVIFVTGLDSTADEERGLELGAVDYVTKPYRPPIVLARVRAQLELKRARDWLADQNAYLEAAVMRRSEILHAVTAAAQDGIIMIDDAGRIAYWNPAAERIFGYEAREALGRELHPLLAPPRLHEACAKGLAGFRATGAGDFVGKTTELSALRKDGTQFPVEISLAAIQRDGAWWSVGVVRDITERKWMEAESATEMTALTWLNDEYKEINDKLVQAQNQLLQSEKLASIGLLAAGVAHEINNPIGFVNSNLGTLKNYVDSLLALVAAYEKAEADSADSTPAFGAVNALKTELDLSYLKEDVGSLLAESLDGLDRVKKIIQSLKDFSHVDTEETWRAEDIRQGIDSTLNVVWNELKYKCEVRKEYGDMPPVECLISHLNQVFMNLLVNAAQAIDDHGTITIRTGMQGEEAWVEIADTGKGIPPENLARIFDPFFTTKPVGKGTGLGLSVTYSIVEKHHGRIAVASEVGKGTTFRIWLPLKQPDGAAASSRQS